MTRHSLFLPCFLLWAAAIGAGPISPALADDIYARPESWLCRPGADDLCAAPIKVAVVRSDGSRVTKSVAANPDAPIDCFYVYPTISEDPNGNSSLVPGPGEKRAVQQQFAPFASVCRPFAPMYQQITLAGLTSAVTGKPLPMDPELAYNDVLAAWRYYLAHDNGGRPFVLIGHSQGARILARLIAETIDVQPEQALFAGAVLLGSNLEVPVGRDVGGTFLSIPVCRAAGQAACVVAYETFPANSPPPPGGRFGHPKDAGMEVACTDPVRLSGERLDPILATEVNLLGQALNDPNWQAFEKPLDAPFVSLPGIAAARCSEGSDLSYFSVSVNASQKTGAWPPALPGDLVVNGRLLPEWGWHLIDVNVALGNLIDIVGKMHISHP